MKITKIEPHLIGTLWFNTLLVKVSTDDGISGWGEASLAGRERPVKAAVEDLAKELTGEDPLRIEYLWQSSYRGAFWRGGPVLASALSGVEQALWDIVGKVHNAPVWQLLGGRCRDKIKIYTHVHGANVEEAAAGAARLVAQGYRALKWAPSTWASGVVGTDAEVKNWVRFVSAIRQAVGPDVDLAVDCHGRLDPATAIRVAKALEPFNLLFFEEPCGPENVDALVNIARSTSIPIATGERFYTVFGFREALEKKAAAVLQPDLAHCGGILQGRKIGGMAEAYYAAMAPHNAYGPVNTAAALHLDTSMPNFLIQEVIDQSINPWLGDIFSPLVKPVDGYVDIPKGPGLGITVNEKELVKHPPQERPVKRWRTTDGSVADV